MNEILADVKAALNLTDESFDKAVTFEINAVLGELHQLGLGTEPFVIQTGLETWSELFGLQEKKLEIGKQLVVLKVKLTFDPSASKTIVDVFSSRIKELEWRFREILETKEEVSL
jgi:hypothetical protein